MNISEKLNRAIAKGPNTGDDDLDDAILEVLQAGVSWFHDFRAEAPSYPDGHPMSEDRLFKVSQEGRATLSLADAVLNQSSQNNPECDHEAWEKLPGDSGRRCADCREYPGTKEDA